MKLTFTRSTQQEADDLRALLERLIETEKSGYHRDAAFEISASAAFVEKDTGGAWARETKKEWQFLVTLEAATQLRDGEGDGGETSIRWRRLFEKLVHRPAMPRGTQVMLLPESLDREQIGFLRGDSSKPDAVAQALLERLAEQSKRGYYRDSEGRVVKADQIVFQLSMEGEVDTAVSLIVDATVAPIADEVLQHTIERLKTDMECAATVKGVKS